MASRDNSYVKAFGEAHDRAAVATYRVVRMFFEDHPARTMATGLTLEEAQAHCRDPETSSRTASEEALASEHSGPWFDGYEEE